MYRSEWVSCRNNCNILSNATTWRARACLNVCFITVAGKRFDILAKHNIFASLKQQVLFAGLYLRLKGAVPIESENKDRADTKSFRE